MECGQVTIWHGLFISNIFPHPKPNGEVKLILDLTLFNDFVEYKHFKMFSLNTARDLITPNSWLASVNLTDAYYTIPIIEHHRKYLCFFWQGQLYEFTCLPNGLACAPRLFTTILKPIFSIKKCLHWDTQCSRISMTLSSLQIQN